MKPRHLYLIKRGPDFAEHMHSSLVRHPVIVCTHQHTARWEAGWSGDRGWMWERPCTNDGSGWLIVRWNGLDIDYGHIVRSFKLPDGTMTGFSHPGNESEGHRSVWNLLRNAAWWSQCECPRWLQERWGVVLPSDSFTLERIAEDAGTCLLSYSAQERIKARRTIGGVA